MSNTNSTPVCLITGGSSGIGLASAKRFAGAGYHIAICGRRPAPLEAARNQITAAGQAHAIRCHQQVVDLNDADQAKRFGEQVLDHFGHVDVLINNAATAPLSPFEDISVETFESAINTNIRSVFYLTQIIWKHMKQRAQASPLEQGRGVVVNISSLAAVDPFPGFSLYGSCKAWLDLLTFALAAEGKEIGLRVCSIRPGAVETPMLRGLFPDYPTEQCVRPEEIAEAVWGCVNEPEQYPSGAAFAVTNQS
jgi:NAD(P)-dependent dehydrogenase (short-subunit alcohol dehydrogenase family)